MLWVYTLDSRSFLFHWKSNYGPQAREIYFYDSIVCKQPLLPEYKFKAGQTLVLAVCSEESDLTPLKGDV